MSKNRGFKSYAFIFLQEDKSIGEISKHFVLSVYTPDTCLWYYQLKRNKTVWIKRKHLNIEMLSCKIMMLSGFHYSELPNQKFFIR